MIAWALETLVASSLLMLLVLLVRAPVRRMFGPGLAYALWLLPVARMLLPPLPASWREQAVAPVAAAGEIVTLYVFDPISEGTVAAAEATTIDWLPILGAAWAAGAALFLLYHLVTHSLFCRRLLRRARVDHQVAEGRVRVIETDAAHGPLAFGIWRKYVAFPRDFNERYDDVERDLALAHELGHHVRGDLIANWVALVVLAVHWFNPIAWRAFRAFRADQEMACDALVLAGRAQALRHAYGRAIVKSAHGGAVSAACHLHTINELKGRLRMLSKAKKTSPARLMAGTAGGVTFALAALGLTASGTQAAEHIRAKMGSSIGIDLMQDAPPAPPAPDAPPAADAPPAPPQAPVAPEAPEAPEAPDVQTAGDGTTMYRYRIERGGEGLDGQVTRVVTRKAGPGEARAVTIRVAGQDSVAPEVTERACGRGDDDQLVIHSRSNGRAHMVICTDRIEAMSERASAAAIHAETARAHAEMSGARAGQLRATAMASARQGLAAAREQIRAMTQLSAEERAEALAGIDSAMVEIEAEARATDD